MADDLYSKYSDDQDDITNSKWEIVNFFRNNYKRTLKDTDNIINNV
jgi:hypothetical protein